MDYKELVIRGISYSQTQSGAYALLLEHRETSVKLPVVIGNFEAQAISIGLEKDIHPPRPLTHELFTQFIRASNYAISQIVIYKILDGVFFSNIHFKNSISAEELVLDARTSDAVAMAIRFDAPIYTTEEVLSEAGILLELDPEPVAKEMAAEEPAGEQGLHKLSMQDLQKLLDDAVKEEDFDTALELQAEIKKRRRNID